MDFLNEVFNFLCGQVHNWSIGGLSLPFCQRCTGLYIGALYAMAAILLFRPRPTRVCLWLHGTFLLVMAPFGFHLVEQNAIIRTVTGQLFGAGLAYFLVLQPADAINVNYLARAHLQYFVALLPGIPILLLAICYGGRFVCSILAWSGLLAFVVLALLSLANLSIVGAKVCAVLRQPVVRVP